VSTR